MDQLVRPDRIRGDLGTAGEPDDRKVGTAAEVAAPGAADVRLDAGAVVVDEVLLVRASEPGAYKVDSDPLECRARPLECTRGVCEPC